MQAKKRYILVFVSCAFLAYCYFGGYRLKHSAASAINGISRVGTIRIPNHVPSFLTVYEYDSLFGMHDSNLNGLDDDEMMHAGTLSASAPIDTIGDVITAAQMLVNNDPNKHFDRGADRNDNGGGGAGGGTKIKTVNDNNIYQAAVADISALGSETIKKETGNNQRPCRMDTCFDYTKCYEANHQLLVYVYPIETVTTMANTPPTSLNYQKILSAITESRYYTPDPERACLFVLGIDTLDRDSLSEDYVRNMPSRLQRLPHWNNGRNHVIFNLYSGTWPDYAENSLGFDTGEAILAKASMSVRQIRPGFDISIPLFHKQHPLRAGNNGFVSSNNFPTNKKYLLAFKGKR